MTDAFAQPMTQEQADELLDAEQDAQWEQSEPSATWQNQNDTWAESRGER